MRKTKQEAEITRRKIVDAALMVFKKKGFDETRLQDIAKESGVTRGAIYWHFTNKMDIVTTLLDEMHGRFDSLLELFQTGEGSAVEQLERLIVEMIVVYAGSERFQDIFSIMLSSGRVMDTMKKRPFKNDFPQKFIGVFSNLVARGIKRGEIRDSVTPQTLAWAILYMFIGSTIVSLKFPQTKQIAQKARDMVDCFMNGILSKSECGETSGRHTANTVKKI